MEKILFFVPLLISIVFCLWVVVSKKKTLRSLTFDLFVYGAGIVAMVYFAFSLVLI